MSLNLSRTLFYEFYKSDPNFIYESVEEYRNYKSDPNFADKTLEEYRRIKALQKKEEAQIHELATSQELASSKFSSDESNENCNKNEKAITSTSEYGTQTVNANKTEAEIEKTIEVKMVDEIVKEITELKMESFAQNEFERSLEQFWNCDEELHSINESENHSKCNSETPSTCDSEASSRCSSGTLLTFEIRTRFNSETEPSPSASKKRVKSMFKIPKSRSTLNLNKVKSRYMDVFKKID